VRDALNLLNEVADKLYPKTEGDDDTADGEADENEDEGASSSTVQQMLQDEIAALKADAKSRKTGRFTPLDTGVRGVLLIKIIDKSISAAALVAKIFQDVEETKEFPSRFVNRLIPLEQIGYSAMEDIKAVAEPMINDFITKWTADEATKDTPIEVP
jgi:tRNA acetyltransferase TAN1